MISFICALFRAAALSAALVAVAAGPRVQSFSFQGATNRMITPNGDRRNDELTVQFANPEFSDVTGTVYDIRGHAVSGMTVGPTVNGFQTLQWDGRSGGSVVPTGVYIYVIQSEGQSIRGAVVVIR